MEKWTSSIAKMSQPYYHHVLNYEQVEIYLRLFRKLMEVRVLLGRIRY